MVEVEMGYGEDESGGDGDGMNFRLNRLNRFHENLANYKVLLRLEMMSLSGEMSEHNGEHQDVVKFQRNHLDTKEPL